MVDSEIGNGMAMDQQWLKLNPQDLTKQKHWLANLESAVIG